MTPNSLWFSPCRSLTNEQSLSRRSIELRRTCNSGNILNPANTLLDIFEEEPRVLVLVLPVRMVGGRSRKKENV